MTRREIFSAVAGVPAAFSEQPKDMGYRLLQMRKFHGDQQALDALAESNGDVLAAQRALNRQQQRERRATEKEKRAGRRSDRVMYHGPVTLGPEILAAVERGKRVKASMSGHKIIRTTLQGTLTGVVGGAGNHIVTFDLRASSDKLSAEVLWTGADYRIHIRRTSPMDQRQKVLIDVI